MRRLGLSPLAEIWDEVAGREERQSHRERKWCCLEGETALKCQVWLAGRPPPTPAQGRHPLPSTPPAPTLQPHSRLVLPSCPESPFNILICQLVSFPTKTYIFLRAEDRLLDHSRSLLCSRQPAKPRKRRWE